MRFGLLLCIALSFWLSPAAAEIVKTAVVTCGKQKEICLYWWPKLPSIPGWHSEDKANFASGGNGINVLVPDGSYFATADAVMYGEAIYKARYEDSNPQSKSLKSFIDDDTAHFASEGRQVHEVDPISTADGQTLRSITFTSDQAFERVSYGEESDYYLLFVINARSEAGYKASQAAYESLIRSYRK